MGIFTKKEKTKYIQPESFPGAAGYRGELAKAAKPGALRRIGLAGTKYQGPLVAALSEFEETGLAGLKDWLGRDLPTRDPLYKAGAEEIRKTLAGEYVPKDSPYYKAYETEMYRQIEKMGDKLFAGRAGLGKLFGGGTVKGLEEIGEAGLGDIAQVLGGITERERERMLGVVPEALRFTQYKETAPVYRTAISQQLGELPRLIEQAEMDADYQEWMRALNDMGIALDVATGLATYQPGMMVMQTGGGKKDWVKDVGTALQIALAVKGLSGGGGA